MAKIRFSQRKLPLYVQNDVYSATNRSRQFNIHRNSNKTIALLCAYCSLLFVKTL